MSPTLVETVDQVIRSRKSVRRFLPTPIGRDLVLQILEVARHAPSNSNTQPWRVYAVAGRAREALSAAIHTAHHGRPDDHTSARPHFPKELGAAYAARQNAFASEYYASLGIDRADQTARHAQTGRNFLFFDAPVGLIFTIDASLEPASWLDCGIFLQSVMLAAKARGLDTCPQISFGKYHAIVRGHLPILASEVILCGMSLGYADAAAPVNQLKIAREPVEAFASLTGFDGTEE